MEHIHLKIVLILTIGFAYASLFGYLAHKIKLSPILGYLIAGFLIGPYSPGFVADMQVAEELAEIGVILMLFGVGMHFQLPDLINVKHIAIPGAIGQTVVAAIAGMLLMHTVGWAYEPGLVFGMAIGVASTVVLIRGLQERKLIATPQGHIAVGWLIVEDIITIFLLLIIPTMADSAKGVEVNLQDLILNILAAVAKFIILIVIVFTVGRKIIEFIFARINLTNSHELFTLTILAITFLIAAGSAYFFGTSMALGAFIAGMVIGQTHLKRKVTMNSTPLQDTFIVLFFLSIGMLFNPTVIVDHFYLFLGTLAIILLIKPITAIVIALVLRQSMMTALTIAVGLAQIGEFSFILAEEAVRLDVFPDEGYDIIVACALVSIAINPLLLKLIPKPLEEQKKI